MRERGQQLRLAVPITLGSRCHCAQFPDDKTELHEVKSLPWLYTARKIETIAQSQCNAGRGVRQRATPLPNYGKSVPASSESSVGALDYQ